MNGNEILLAFYGDDFTGSTDALEFISRAGAKAVLFTEVPTAEELAAIPGLNAYGVAGKTRALAPAEMEKILLPAFEQMKASGARHVHYKVCSTFDSSPVIGSIGKAIDCGASVFKNRFIPVLGGSPSLGRYCVFGNLYARMGIGSKGKIYRLDRHPSMSQHPVTPADESDLRLHLGKQTTKKIGLIDWLQWQKKLKEWKENIQEGEEVVLLDALYESQLMKIGKWIDRLAREKTQFSVGGSGIEVALGDHWNAEKVLFRRHEWKKLKRANPLLVISGSCSPVTTRQIGYAKSNGFEELVADAISLGASDDIPGSILEELNRLLGQHKNVIVHTGARQEANLPAEKLGTALGRIAKEAVARNDLRRVVVSGGDTSSYAARALEIGAVEMIAPLVTGAPLCKAYSKNKAIDGVEINFKGGQVGAEDYFAKAVGE